MDEWPIPNLLASPHLHGYHSVGATAPTAFKPGHQVWLWVPTFYAPHSNEGNFVKT